jgi:ferritin-like metal-binding protein YciE
MTMRNLEDAFLDEMRDMLSAERQIARALKKMAKKASHEQLTEAFEEHLTQTEDQIHRLEQVFESLGRAPRARRCDAMAGIIDEGKEMMEEASEPGVLDALLIASAQKVEHYEIASYGTLCTWAEMLGHDEAKKLLHQTLEEEKETDQKLTRMAMEINRQAQPAS